MPDTDCRIVDPENPLARCPPATSGELSVSGPQIMRGYYGDADQTRRVLTADADGRTWLHTGDLALMQPDGYFVILDRKKDMIIRSGLKIFPGRVEKVLQSDARVTDAAVVGRDDLVHTQIVVAWIVSRVPAEQREALVQDLRTLCREHLAPYEVPAEFEFIDVLPRSPLGKLLKKDLIAKPPWTPMATGMEEWLRTRAGGNTAVDTDLIHSDLHSEREPEWCWNMSDRRVAVVSGARTPFAKSGGAIKDVHAADLGKRSDSGDALPGNWPADDVDEVILGNVVMPVDAANLARVAAIWAGVPVRVPGLTMQRNCARDGSDCGSGGPDPHRSRKGDCRGGAESMSNIPLLFPNETMEPMAPARALQERPPEGGCCDGSASAPLSADRGARIGTYRSDLRHDHGKNR